MDFNLDTFLPYKLSLATNTVSQKLAKEYATFGLTRTQWRVIAVLGDGREVTAGAIAQKTLMDKTTLSRAIKNLTERKLVKRKTSQSDGRASPLVLTISGGKVFQKIVPLALAEDARLRRKLSARDVQTLEKILEQLLEEN